MKTLKHITFFLITTLLLNSCAGNDLKNDLKEDELKGKVKFFKEFDYEAVEKFGEVTKEEVTNGFEPFREKIYNEKGNVVEKKIYDSSENLKRRTVVKYDNKNDKIVDEIYDTDGKIMFTWYYKYDDNRKKIEQNVNNSEGKFIRRLIYKYDSEDRIIEINTYDYNGNLEGRNIIEYTGKINKTESNYNNKEELLSKIQYEYDQNENMSTLEFNLYNFYGKDIKNTYHHMYKKFDEKGNWIERIQYDEENVPTMVTERKIEYYK